MSTLSLNYAFASGAQGWAFTQTSGSHSSLTNAWDNLAGNPGGSLRTVQGGAASEQGTGYWMATGTWESLGVPSGSTVTAIQLNRADEYVSANAGGNVVAGPYYLADSGGTTQATLLGSRTQSALDPSWQSRTVGASQSVPSGLQPSATSVQLRFDLAIGGSGSYGGTVNWDNLNFTITYSGAVPWSAAAASVASAASSVALAMGLVASAGSTSSASATLGYLGGYAASAASVSSAGASLTLGGMAASASSVATSSASLGNTGGLSAAADSVTTAEASLSLAMGLSGFATAISSAGAAVATGWSASANSVTTATADLATGAPIAASANAVATAGASLSLAMGLSVAAATSSASALVIQILPGVFDVVAVADRGELLLTWTSTGEWFQVYLGGKLAWNGPANQARLPMPPSPVSIDVIAVDPSAATYDYSATLPPQVGTGSRVTLNWEGGTFEGADIAGFNVYSGTAPGGAISYATPLDTVPVTIGRVLDGFGMGGFGRGGFGFAASNFSWQSDAMSPGTWNFGVKAVDSAGNEGPAYTWAVTITGPPRAPAPFPDHLRLHISYSATTHAATLNWNASP